MKQKQRMPESSQTQFEQNVEQQFKAWQNSELAHAN